MPLDDQYSEIRDLNINETNSEVLHVNTTLWDNHLLRYERKANLGCAIFFLLFFIVPFIFSIKSAYLLLAFLFFAIGYKVVNAKKANNLRIHGAYKFEISKDKIVRYSNSNYDIFRFDELIEIRVKPYGMVLRKKKQFFDYLGMSVFRHQRKTQMIIPKELYSFDQVKNFIRMQISGGSNSRLRSS